MQSTQKQTWPPVKIPDEKLVWNQFSREQDHQFSREHKDIVIVLTLKQSNRRNYALWEKTKHEMKTFHDIFCCCCWLTWCEQKWFFKDNNKNKITSAARNMYVVSEFPTLGGKICSTQAYSSPWENQTQLGCGVLFCRNCPLRWQRVHTVFHRKMQAGIDHFLRENIRYHGFLGYFGRLFYSWTPPIHWLTVLYTFFLLWEHTLYEQLGSDLHPSGEVTQELATLRIIELMEMKVLILKSILNA